MDICIVSNKFTQCVATGVGPGAVEAKEERQK